MRTKTLLLAGGALVAGGVLALGLLTSKAQVYSQNVVGYVNVAITNNDFTAVSTPLDYDGTGTNDTVINVLGTNLPVGSVVETWNGATFNQNPYSKPKSGPAAWGSPNNLITPGLGYFISNPSNYVVTLTFVGTVLQGNLTNPFVATGFTMIGGQFPVNGGLDGTFGYTPSIGDILETWQGSTLGYAQNPYSKPKSGPAVWGNGDPQFAPGTGYFLDTTNLNPLIATNFTVH